MVMIKKPSQPNLAGVGAWPWAELCNKRDKKVVCAEELGLFLKGLI